MTEEIREDIDRWMRNKMNTLIRDTAMRYQVADVEFAEAMTSIILTLMSTTATFLEELETPPKIAGEALVELMERRVNRKKGEQPK